jgi:hypothetical protein
MNRYLLNYKINLIEFNSLQFHQKFLSNKKKISKSSFLKNEKKFTFNYNRNNDLIYKNNQLTFFLNSIFTLSYKIKKIVTYSNHWSKIIYDRYNNVNNFDKNYLIKIWQKFHYSNKKNKHLNNNLWNFFDINFLKKEKIYTKLKYSRVPQYDIVSGGVAAIFAGFLGFLICEKFGFELLDSGDFYFLFMYLVFGIFFIRLLIKTLNNEINNWNPLSFKWFLCFYSLLTKMFIKKINIFK